MKNVSAPPFHYDISIINYNLLNIKTLYRIIFKTVWSWPLIDDLNYPIDWDRLGERLSVTITAHYVLVKDTESVGSPKVLNT